MVTSKASARKLTYDDFLSFPDDGQRHELIDGEHHVTPSPATKHPRVAMRLTLALGTYFNTHPIGEVFIAPFDVVLSNTDIVEPDLLVVLKDQADIVTAKHVRGAPALVIEILSPGTKRVDGGAKLRLYDRSGVREYWLVDPADDTVTVFRRSDMGTLMVSGRLTLASGDAITSPLLPDWASSLTALFSNA